MGYTRSTSGRAAPPDALNRKRSAQLVPPVDRRPNYVPRHIRIPSVLYSPSVDEKSKKQIKKPTLLFILQQLVFLFFVLVALFEQATRDK